MTDTTTAADLLTLDEVADLIGVARASVRVYHQRASNNRKAGKTRTSDMPLPDALFGRIPTWKRSTILAWDAAREKRAIKEPVT